jgi:hypothetical protein
MTDVAEAIHTHLLADAALTALVVNRIYAEADTPPVGYKPSDGGAVCFKVRGGWPDGSDLLMIPSVQCKCYGVSRLAANAVYRAVYHALHNTRAGSTVRWGQVEVIGQTLTEPDTQGGSPWWFNLSFFTVYVGMTT